MPCAILSWPFRPGTSCPISDSSILPPWHYFFLLWFFTLLIHNFLTFSFSASNLPLSQILSSPRSFTSPRTTFTDYHPDRLFWSNWVLFSVFRSSVRTPSHHKGHIRDFYKSDKKSFDVAVTATANWCDFKLVIAAQFFVQKMFQLLNDFVARSLPGLCSCTPSVPQNLYTSKTRLRLCFRQLLSACKYTIWYHIISQQPLWIPTSHCRLLGGAVAQWVERWTCDQQVVDSNPTRG